MASNDIHEKTPRGDGFFYGKTYRMNKRDDEIGLALGKDEPEVISTEKDRTGKLTAENTPLSPPIIH